MGCAPEQGHSGAADFSAHFLRIFAWLWNTCFSSAKTSKKNLRENGRKNLRTKKTGLNIPFVWKMEARKQKTQKKSAPNLRKTPAPSYEVACPL